MNKEKQKIYRKRYYEKNKETYNNYAYKLDENNIPYYTRNRISRCEHGDLLNTKDYNSGEITPIANLITAVPKAKSTNKYSKRKGVCKNCRGQWIGHLTHNKIKYRKEFKTYEEAVTYREYLEDKYFNDKQKKIKEYFENQQK